MNRVAVIGGGLAGLTTALRLVERAEVHVLEASARLGGQIHTEYSDGFVIEHGGEGFVARSEAVPALVRDLGLPEDEVVGQAVMRSYGFDGQTLRALAPGEAASLLGFQVPQEELGKGIRTMRRGMGSLIDALAAALQGRVNIALNTQVTGLSARGARALTIQTRSGSSLEVDAAVVATTACTAAPILSELVGDRAKALAEAPTLSSVTVELAFRRDQIAHPLDGTGFVVALAAQQDGVRACTFTTSKFSERGPADLVSLRVFLRPSDDELATLDDAAWVARARAGLTRVLPVDGAPLLTRVSSWPHALPVFTDAHRASVAAVESALRPYPVVLAGSAFHGSGIDAAIRSAERATQALLTEQTQNTLQ